jgi:hypothetical protein
VLVAIFGVLVLLFMVIPDSNTPLVRIVGAMSGSLLFSIIILWPKTWIIIQESSVEVGHPFGSQSFFPGQAKVSVSFLSPIYGKPFPILHIKSAERSASVSLGFFRHSEHDEIINGVRRVLRS